MLKNKIYPNFECYQDDLLLHSMANYIYQIRQVLNVIKPKSITEVGVEGGKFSKELLEYCNEANIKYFGIETSPTKEVEQLIVHDYGQTLIIKKSLDTDAEIALLSDVIFLDGDHNYYTVSHELKKIFSANSSIVFLHDIGWPCAYRDLYYDVNSIPDDSKHPYSYDGGLVPGMATLQEIGFSGKGHYAVAMDERTSHNGVLKAVEDFLENNQHLDYVQLNSIFGLGIVYNYTKFNESQKELFDFLKKSLDFWNPLLANLEQNRMELHVEIWKQADIVQQLDQQLDQQLKKLQNSKMLIKQIILNILRMIKFNFRS